MIDRRFYSRRALLRGSAVLAAPAVTLLSGCGSQTPSGKPAASSGGGTPRSGGQMTVRVATDPFDWDVSYTGKSVPNQEGVPFAYSALLSFTSGPKVPFSQLTIQPGLAERWESQDPQTYVFHLRPGLRFADVAPVNGRPLTSADVKWSIEYASRKGQVAGSNLPQGQFDWFFEGLNAIETPDPSTVVLRFQKPFAPFLSYAGADYNEVVPHEIFDQYGSFKDHVAGSGPFQLDASASQKGSRWVWNKNPAYWDSGKPYIDRITWLVLPDDASTRAAFQTRSLDLLGGASDNLTTTAAQQVKKDNPAATMFEYIAPTPLHLYMNTRSGPLSDARVRQAISLATDRDEFIKTFSGGQGGWALAGALPDTYSPDEIKQVLKFDPAQARKLVEASGYGSGLNLEFLFPGNANGDLYIAQMQLFQAQLKNAGITLNLKSADKDTWSNARKKGTYEITLVSKDLVADVDSYLYATFHTGSRDNYAGTSDKQLDALLEAQRQELDTNKRRETVRQAVRLIADQAYGLAMYYGAAYQFWQPKLKNYAPNFGRLGWPLASSWLEG
jgi:peptide/nickel transport system substrate-binding protein